MPANVRKPLPGQIHLSRRSYLQWANTVAQLTRTPKSLKKPRSEASDLEIAAALIHDMRPDLIQLWETFTTERADVSRYLMDPKREALVYLLGFHLANQARTLGVLLRLQRRSGLLSSLSERAEPVRLVDLGCGTGALSLTTAQELKELNPNLALSFELIDKSQNFLEAAAMQAKALVAEDAVLLRRQKLDDYLSRELSNGPAEGLVWYQIGYLWNEIMQSPKTTQLMLRYLEAGLQKGKRVLTIIEPANQDLARGAMELRQELVNRGYQVLYPCSHNLDCPMLERTRDWCYSEFAWERPPLVRNVDKILEIDRHRIGCAAYVFVSPDMIKDFRQPASIVVGRPLDRNASMHSRKFEYLLCSEDGLSKATPGEGLELMRGQTFDPVKERASTKPKVPKAEAKPTPEAKPKADARKPGVRKPQGRKAPRKER